MSFLTSLYLKMPFIIANATAAAPNTEAGGSLVSSIIGYIAGGGAAIIAIVMLISIIKDSIAYSSGNGGVSVMKIAGKVLFLFVMIGLIFAIATGYVSFGNSAKKVADGVLDQVEEEINQIIPGQ